MPLIGDFAGLAKLEQALDRLGSPAAVAGLARNMGEELVSLVQQGFRASKDPYGAPWAPLKFRAGKPLQDTRANLEGSLSASTSADRIRIGFGFAYAAVHQYGATIRVKRAKQLYSSKLKRGFGKQVTIPARPMLPSDARGLPAAWQAALNEVAEEYIESIFGGAARAAE